MKIDENWKMDTILSKVSTVRAGKKNLKEEISPAGQVGVQGFPRPRRSLAEERSTPESVKEESLKKFKKASKKIRVGTGCQENKLFLDLRDDLIIDYSSSRSKSPVSTSCSYVKKKAEENYKLVFKVAKNYLLDRLVA